MTQAQTMIERVSEAGGNLDDLAISGEQIELLRLARMDDSTAWGRIYMRDGSFYELTVSARTKLALKIEHLAALSEGQEP